MTHSEIITSIANDKEIKKVAMIIAKGNDVGNDLFQEMLIILIDENQDKLAGIFKRHETKWYCTRIMNNMFKGKHTPFYKKHLSVNSNTDMRVYMEDREVWPEIINIDRFNKILSEIDPHELALIKTTTEYKSFNKLAREIGIPQRSLWDWVDKIKKQIKEKYGKI